MTYLTGADYEAIDNEGGRFDRRSMFATVERIAARVAAETRESVLDEVERRLGDFAQYHVETDDGQWAWAIPWRNVAATLRDLRGGEDRG